MIAAPVITVSLALIARGAVSEYHHHIDLSSLTPICNVAL